MEHDQGLAPCRRRRGVEGKVHKWDSGLGSLHKHFDNICTRGTCDLYTSWGKPEHGNLSRASVQKQSGGVGSLGKW